jgi:hypothetical protein
LLVDGRIRIRTINYVPYGSRSGSQRPKNIRILRIRNTDFRADLIWPDDPLKNKNKFPLDGGKTITKREWGMDKCGPAYSAAAHLPALPHPLGYFWPGKHVPTRFSALVNALQQKTNMSQALFCSVADPDPGSGAFFDP